MPKEKSTCCFNRKRKKNKILNNDYFMESVNFEAVNQDANTKTSHVLFAHQLSAPLDEGSYVTIIGKVNPSCLRFAVDFVCGQRSITDGLIAFHFNPRLDCQYVVRNSLMHGAWESEETTSWSRLRLKPGGNFKLHIFVTETEYLVLLNGRHFCSFSHRVKARSVTSIDITGDVIVDAVNVTRQNLYPPIADQIVHEVVYDVDYNERDCTEYVLPYKATLKDKLSVGNQLEVYGRVKLLPHTFFVNIQRGSQIWPHPVIALHLNPRFSGAIGANSFIRNSWSNGEWMQEERAPCFPFKSGHPFLLVVRIEQNAYSVWVNNKLTGQFPFRALHPVKVEDGSESVHIEGDIYLDHVTVRKQIKNVQFNSKDMILTQI